MKVIDLLNKIANGEEVPNKIMYDYREFEFKEGAYEDKEGKDLCYREYSCSAFLNDEVEIPDEYKKEHKIPKKLKWVDNNTFFHVMI